MHAALDAALSEEPDRRRWVEYFDAVEAKARGARDAAEAAVRLHNEAAERALELWRVSGRAVRALAAPHDAAG